jgi:alkyl hydroperoxide reductase subunit AhpF
MAGLIGREDAEGIRKELADGLVADVKLTLLGPSALAPPARDLTPQIRQLYEEVVALSPKLSLEYVDLPTPEQREALGLAPGEGGPITILSGRAKGKVRYVGAPAGHEFPNLIHGIVDVSRGESDLSPASREALAKITRPVHIRVFFTPT